MSEARRLLKKAMGYLPSDASVFHQIRAYLAQPSREGELVAALRASLAKDGHHPNCSSGVKDYGCSPRCKQIRAALGEKP